MNFARKITIETTSLYSFLSELLPSISQERNVDSNTGSDQKQDPFFTGAFPVLAITFPVSTETKDTKSLSHPRRGTYNIISSNRLTTFSCNKLTTFSSNYLFPCNNLTTFSSKNLTNVTSISLTMFTRLNIQSLGYILMQET